MTQAERRQLLSDFMVKTREESKRQEQIKQSTDELSSSSSSNLHASETNVLDEQIKTLMLVSCDV